MTDVYAIPNTVLLPSAASEVMERLGYTGHANDILECYVRLAESRAKWVKDTAYGYVILSHHAGGDYRHSKRWFKVYAVWSDSASHAAHTFGATLLSTMGAVTLAGMEKAEGAIPVTLDDRKDYCLVWRYRPALSVIGGHAELYSRFIIAEREVWTEEEVPR